jgi:L-ascorbate metabolism protein UlaG (beta-lactamase superfamily)
MQALSDFLKNIHWLGHASFRIDANNLVIYFDPWQLTGGPKADLICITHDHEDHCSPSDILKIQKNDTVIVAIPSCKDKLKGQILTVKPYDHISVKEIQIEAIPAYNVNKINEDGKPFHQQKAGYVGYILVIDGLRIFHVGDTDLIPEFSDMAIDIVFLPISGKYVMTVEEAAKAIEILKPKIAIPMHVGRGIGTMQDISQFKNLSPSIVKILPLES